MSDAEASPLSVGDYLAERLYDRGVRHVFHVPGPFVDRLVEQCERAGLVVVSPLDGQSAGFMADAYARMRGFGVAIGGYGAGALQLVNPVAQAFAERSPVLVIGAAPGLREATLHPLVPSPGEPGPQARVFAPLTVAAAVLDDPDIAPREIERVLAAIGRENRPGYIEVPYDLLAAPTTVGPAPRPAVAAGDPRALAAALDAASALVEEAARPVMVLGVEVQRFGLQDPVLRLLANAGIPAAVTLLGKSVIGEDSPGFLGIYAGARSRPSVREAVESADALLLIGARPTDLNPGGTVPRLDPAHAIDARGDRLSVGYGRYDDVPLTDFIHGLAARLPHRDLPARGLPATGPLHPGGTALGEPGDALDGSRFFARLARFLTDEMVVVADPGEALFAAADLPIRLCSEFMSPASYGARGFAVPACIGVQLAEPELRPVVLVEATAFPATGPDLLTAARLGLGPIVLVLHRDPAAAPVATGLGQGAAVPAPIARTVADLERALARAVRYEGGPSVIEVALT
ncbi:MAG: alpha-keto acid decarboxylase family protein [Chloroflexia bacterium]|nr:alpha-keto acid decarboxylase family protein [Chloroflexia bacterium]